MTRVGVIADTHINSKKDELPKEILEAFKGVDMVIHAGDLIDLSVLDKLKRACKDVRAVYGNMDPEETRKVLPQKELIEVNGHKIGLAHGYGTPAGLVDILEKMFKDDNVDVVVFGHSHQPFNEKKGKTLYFNPGSPTDKVFAPFNSYGILEIDDKVEGKIIKI
jgi:uncharacterized protein